MSRRRALSLSLSLPPPWCWLAAHFRERGKTTTKQSQKPDGTRLSPTCSEEENHSRKFQFSWREPHSLARSLSRASHTHQRSGHGETHALDLLPRRPKNPTQHKQQGKNQAESSWPSFLFFFVIQLMREPSSLELNTSKHAQPERSCQS